MIHSSNLATCERLQRVYALLADGKEHSTLDIVIGARVCAVNTCISELRSNGLKIHTRRESNKRYYYRLEK